MSFNQGAKFDDGKPAFGLLAPEMLFGVAEILEYGARKYAARNWEKGISYTRVFSGLMRHLWAWWSGEKHDPETGKSHLWHAGCGLMFLIAYEARGMREFDDRAQPLKAKVQGWVDKTLPYPTPERFGGTD